MPRGSGTFSNTVLSFTAGSPTQKASFESNNYNLFKRFCDFTKLPCFAVDADRGLLYVASDGYQFNGTYLGVVYNGVSTNGTVTVVDERTKTITDTIVTGPASGSLKAVTERVVLDPENGPLYATNFYGGSVVVIDPRTHKVTDTITTAVGGENNGIDIDLVSRKIYVADYLNGNVNIIKAADARPPFYDVLIHDWAWYTAHAYP